MELQRRGSSTESSVTGSIQVQASPQPESDSEGGWFACKTQQPQSLVVGRAFSRPCSPSENPVAARSACSAATLPPGQAARRRLPASTATAVGFPRTFSRLGLPPNGLVGGHFRWGTRTLVVLPRRACLLCSRPGSGLETEEKKPWNPSHTSGLPVNR